MQCDSMWDRLARIFWVSAGSSNTRIALPTASPMRLRASMVALHTARGGVSNIPRHGYCGRLGKGRRGSVGLVLPAVHRMTPSNATSHALLNSCCSSRMLVPSISSRLCSKTPSSAATCGHGCKGGAYTSNHHAPKTQAWCDAASHDTWINQHHQAELNVGQSFWPILGLNRPAKTNASCPRYCPQLRAQPKQE